MYPINLPMLYMKEVLHLMRGLYGLVTTGRGVVEGMYTNAAIGQDHVPAALMYPEAGTTTAIAVTHGIKDIGQDNHEMFNQV
jgi:hypothetical protein